MYVIRITRSGNKVLLWITWVCEIALNIALSLRYQRLALSSGLGRIRSKPMTRKVNQTKRVCDVRVRKTFMSYKNKGHERAPKWNRFACRYYRWWAFVISSPVSPCTFARDAPPTRSPQTNSTTPNRRRTHYRSNSNNAPFRDDRHGSFTSHSAVAGFPKRNRFLLTGSLPRVIRARRRRWHLYAIERRHTQQLRELAERRYCNWLKRPVAEATVKVADGFRRGRVNFKIDQYETRVRTDAESNPHSKG